jgi:2-phospho-L-lactate guanylyltransferase
VNVAVIVPVKSFTLAKGRLASSLSDNDRSLLAKRCAERVVAAAAPWPVYVVCDSEDIAEWARALGARVVVQTTSGLNAAVTSGVEAARSDGAHHVVISHADLPLATSFTHLVLEGSVCLVPDRRVDGTNVLSLPADALFDFAYGPGSYQAHVTRAEAAGLPHVTVTDEALGLDLDTADDLEELERRRSTTP